MKNIKKYLVLATLVPVLALSLGYIAKADNNGNGHGNNGNRSEENRGRENEDHMRKATGSTLEVHINNDGKVLARGGKVTAVSGNTITATLTFGSNVMTWTINTNDSTKFVRKNGGAANVSEVAVGDFISWSGNLDTSTTGLAVTASIVKDWSNNSGGSSGGSNSAQVYEGILQSIEGTTAPTSFVMKKNNTDYTVNVPVGISILGNNWLVIPLSSLQVGDHIRVYGTLTNTTVDASVVRDTDR